MTEAHLGTAAPGPVLPGSPQRLAREIRALGASGGARARVCFFVSSNSPFSGRLQLTRATLQETQDMLGREGRSAGGLVSESRLATSPAQPVSLPEHQGNRQRCGEEQMELKVQN